MSNVKPFKDSIIPGQPVPDVIEDLERLLEKAKSGHLRAVAYATVNMDGAKATGWSGGDGTRDKLAASVMMLAHRYAGAMLE